MLCWRISFSACESFSSSLMIFGLLFMRSFTVSSKKRSWSRCIVRRMSPSVTAPRIFPSSTTTAIPIFVRLICSRVSLIFDSRVTMGRLSLIMKSFTFASRRRPSEPPGWNLAKSFAWKLRTVINAHAMASPMASVAVVDEVGARLSGQASCVTDMSR